MSNVKVKINVDFGETEDAVTENGEVKHLDDGVFELVISHESEFDIDHLESAALNTCYPALRDALSKHLEKAGKKKPASS